MCVLCVYRYANPTCVYLTFIWTCVVVSVIIVACSLCVFLSMYLFTFSVGVLFVDCVCYMCR